MAYIFNGLVWLGRDRRAVTALEYGLIAAAVVVVGLSAFSLIGDQLANTVANVTAALPDEG